MTDLCTLELICDMINRQFLALAIVVYEAKTLSLNQISWLDSLC